MTTLNCDHISTKMLPPATSYAPVEGRKYTISHDDVIAKNFVSIGHVYDYDLITDLRDEVLAEWVPHMGQYVLIGKVYVSRGEYDENTSHLRYMIFKKEIEKALRAIVISDSEFYKHFPWFLDFPIYIHFESNLTQYNQVINFGTPRSYTNHSICQSAI
jgi:hypothetical protein